MKNPYASFRRLSGRYPEGITAWVYPEFNSTITTYGLGEDGELWFHPLQTGSDTNQRPTGHDVHRMLIEEDSIVRCFDLETLKRLEKHPELIPCEWISLGILVLGWKSAGYNTDGDMCVPHLNCRVSTPVIRWRTLSSRMSGAEATPLVRV